MKGPWAAKGIEKTEGNQLLMSNLLKTTESKPHVTAKLPENCKTVRKKTQAPERKPHTDEYLSAHPPPQFLFPFLSTYFNLLFFF